MGYGVVNSMIDHLKAAEILTAGVCPLQCAYCYIPKVEEMKKVHEHIAESIRSGEIFDKLIELYGNKLESLGFWGTEPTLTLKLIEEKIPLIMKSFPNLNNFDYSTSMMTDPKTILDFAIALSKTGRKINYKVQISLDGPAFITDKNRIKGAAEQIPKNIEWILNELNKADLKNVNVLFRWKPTFEPNNIKEILETPSLIDEYYNYFDSVEAMIKRNIKNKNVDWQFGSCLISLMVPGKYTSEDGRMLTQLLKLVHEKDRDTTYTNRLERLLNLRDDFNNRFIYSCSGGDSNLGVGDNIHICHRTFFYDKPEYIEAVLRQNMDNWDVSHFQRKMLGFIRNRFIIPADEEDEITRFLYTLRGHHDFWAFQISYCDAMIKELATNGQADKEFLKDDALRFFFALYLNTGLNCPMENVLNTGSINLQTVSLIRMFGNGAFIELMNRVKGKWK